MVWTLPEGLSAIVFAIRNIAFLYSGLLNSRHVPLANPQFNRKRFLGRVMR